jgi:thiol:disulfide interchange protein
MRHLSDAYRALIWSATLVVMALAGCERKTQRYSVTVSRTVESDAEPLATAEPTVSVSMPIEAESIYTVAKYDPQRDPATDLAATVLVAQDSNKRILLQVGGEWCGWCHKLDAYVAEHTAVSQAIGGNFVIMKVNYSDDNKNEAFLAQYPTIPGYPHLYVLESDGTLLHSQNTGELEEGSSYNEGALLAFVDRWKTN